MVQKSPARFSKNLTFDRLLSAAGRRIRNLPHRLTWRLNLGDANFYKQKLLRYQNIHLGERCFIIGNGPSLKSMNLELLNSEYSIGLNRIYLLFDQIKFKPTYLVSINSLVLDQFSDEISALEIPKFLNWNQRKHYSNQDEATNFIKLSFALGDRFQKEITSPISSGGTVTYAAMQIAYWMGFKEVILIGVDHNFVDKGTPNKTEIRRSEIDENHFHPNYFPKGSKWQLPDLQRSELAYRLAKEAYQADGRRIVDATVGGKLKVFDKIDFEKAITG